MQDGIGSSVCAPFGLDLAQLTGGTISSMVNGQKMTGEKI